MTDGNIYDMLRDKFRDDIIGFVKGFVNVEPFPYQEKFLLDNSKRQVFVAGRRVGKSFMTTMKALHFAWTNPNKLVLIVSVSKEQAIEVFEYIKHVIDSSIILKKTLRRKTQTLIEFNNGSRIKVVPAGESGKSVRGYTADMVIVDEAGFIPDEVFVAIEPTLATTHGYLILIGSPGEPAGRFYEAYKSAKEWEELPPDKKEKAPKYWSLHHATIFDNPLVDEEFIEDFKRSHSETEIKRELYGEFASLDESFFNIDDVRKVAILTPKTKPDPNYTYYAGLDVAYTGDDYTVLVLVGIPTNRQEPILEMHAYYSIKKKPPSYIVYWVKKKLAIWSPKALYVDTTGIGYSVYDLLKQQLGDDAHKVKGINFSSSDKDKMFFKLRELIEEEKILLLDDSELLNQFLSYEVNVRKDGSIHIKKKKRAKDDITDALSLAVWGYHKGNFNYEYVRGLDIDNVFRAPNTIKFGSRWF